MTKYIIALILLLAALAGLIWKDSRKPRTFEFMDSAAEVLPPAQPKESTIQGEDQWLMQQMALRVAELAALASGSQEATAELIPSSTPGITYKIEASAGAQNYTADLKQEFYFWSPEGMLPMAAALLGDLTEAGSNLGTSTLPETLLKPETATLCKEAQRISTALAADPRSVTLHEEAALVLGVMAFRETAGRFSDNRVTLCRASSHLTIARSLNRDPGLPGKLAEALLLALVGRQVDAVKHASELPQSAEAWARAIRMRATHDWRLLEKPADATLLEQIALAYALINSRDATALAVFLAEAQPSPVPDWSRIALETMISVEDGHLFSESALDRELMDAQNARMALEGKRPTQDELIQLLAGDNTTKSGTTHNLAAILTWEMVAAYHERHLLHVIERLHFFYDRRWGVQEEALVLREFAEANLSRLKLYPFLFLTEQIPAGELQTAVETSIRQIEETPSLIPAGLWKSVENAQSRVALRKLAPRMEPWFGEQLKFGTAYDLRHRIMPIEMSGRSSASELLAIAPYELLVLRSAAARKRISRGAEFVEFFKDIAPYNVHAQEVIAEASRGDPKAYSQAMEAAAAMDPNNYIVLFRTLRDQGRRDEAARAFEQALAKSTDRVRLSNNVSWIIDYYMDKGETEKALAVANGAAEVYSYRGLESAGMLMVRLERWDEALAHFSAIAERYDDPGPLMQMLFNRRHQNSKLNEAWDRIIGNVFPDGLVEVKLEDFNGKPKTGNVIASTSEHTTRHGLRDGDVIVALDGFKADNLQQYMVLRAMKPDTTPVIIIYWNGSEYKQLTASLPGRRFGCELIPVE